MRGRALGAGGAVEATNEFKYTETVEEFVVPQDGLYRLTACGAKAAETIGAQMLSQLVENDRGVGGELVCASSAGPQDGPGVLIGRLGGFFAQLGHAASGFIEGIL